MAVKICAAESASGVGVLAGVAVGSGVGEGVVVGVGVAVGVGVGVGLGVGVAVGSGVRVGVAVGTGVKVGVAVDSRLKVGAVAVGVAVGSGSSPHPSATAANATIIGGQTHLVMAVLSAACDCWQALAEAFASISRWHRIRSGGPLDGERSLARYMSRAAYGKIG